MRIKEIDIRDFRCFQEYHCRFSPGVNVLIGLNGAGKTTLLHAIHKAMSFIFSNNRTLGKEFLSQGNNTLNVRGFKDGDYRFDPVSRVPSPDASISAKAVFNQADLSWKLYRRNQMNAALYQRFYKDAFTSFMREWKENQASLPLLAYYSDSYPHKEIDARSYALNIVRRDVMPRNFGYYQWDDESSCTSIWEERMCNSLNRVLPSYSQLQSLSSKMRGMEEMGDASSLKDNEEYAGLKNEEMRIREVYSPRNEEIEYVTNTLKRFAKELPGIEGQKFGIDFLSVASTLGGYQVVINFMNGSSSPLQDLPAGYRRLYSIVFDMAYRSFILNGADSEPSGMVIIDELDLHLHPSLEQAILAGLSNVFPKVQFIVSTHSAAVIANLDTNKIVLDQGKEVKANQILAMKEGANSPELLPSIYGIDYSSALRDFMDAPSRNIELRALMDMYLTYYGHNLIKEAASIYNEILTKVGEGSSILEELEERKRNYEVH